MSVFICYAHEDAEAAEKLYRQLRLLGVEAWLDKENLLGGQDWQAAIKDAIAECSHFIALISRHSVNKRGFVQQELRLAMEELDRCPPGKVFLIPVRLDDVEPKHAKLAALHRVDLFKSYDEALTKLAASLGLPEEEIQARLAKLDEQSTSKLPLVGRDEQIHKLQQKLDAACAGECQLVLVEGSVGIGKSRLLRELGELAQNRGLRVLHGRFADHRSALAYQGFYELLQDYFRSYGNELPKTPPDLSDLMPDLLAHFPALAHVPGLAQFEPQAASILGTVTPIESSGAAAEVESTKIFELIALTLSRLSDGSPLVVILENLHEGDVSLRALEYAVSRLGPAKILFAGTFEPLEIDEDHQLSHLLEGFRDSPRFCRLALGPLEAGAFRQLVEALLAEGTLQDETAAKLLEATDGNPFFARELVQSLRETEAIHLDDDGLWRLGGRAITWPKTAMEVVEHRAHRLGKEDRDVLSKATVLGRRFDFEDLVSLAKERVGLPERRFDEALDGLIRGGWLMEDRSSRGDQLVFASGVVRDVLYQALLRRTRRDLHRRHAEQLEARFKGRLDRVYPRLVHHYSEADVASKTVTYSLLQAKRSLEAWSPDDAVRICASALDYADREDLENGLLARGELLLTLARAEQMTGHIEAAAQHAEQAVDAFEQAERSPEAATAALLLAEISWRGRELVETLRWVKRGRELAADSDSIEILQGLLTLGARAANLRGWYKEAKKYQDQAESLLPRSPAETVRIGGELVTALPVRLTSLDPCELKADEEAEVAANVFETLLETASDGSLTAALCSSWQNVDGGRELRLTLRPEVRFSDGSSLRAQDVKKSLERSVRFGGAGSQAALSAVDGFEEFSRGEHSEIRGIRCRGDHQVVFELVEPVPIFPSLLTIPDTAVVRELEPSRGMVGLLGTGPFRFKSASAEDVVLERNPNYWRGSQPPLERLRFRTSIDASGIARLLNSGEIDLGRDLLPEDLEKVLRDPRFRSGFVDATKKNVYFLLFHQAGPVAQHKEVRLALGRVLRIPDLVWSTLGRFAQPAASLIPPGVLGYHAGFRRRTLGRGDALAALEQVGLSLPIELRATVHPLLMDRYGALTKALLAEWASLGVEVKVKTGPMEQYREAYDREEDIDLILGRWVADFGDPDNFTHGLFHSRDGILRRFYSSPEADYLLIKARQRRQAKARQRQYQKFQGLLDREGVLVPLFHDIDYRVANPKVLRGLQLRNSYPYVNYAELGKTEGGPTLDHGESSNREGCGGEIHVPIVSPVDTLDPTVGMLVDYFEVIPNVFETLTRVQKGAGIDPWLAAKYKSDSEGRQFRFWLRPDVRFHDGRKLEARHVLYSFERVLKSPTVQIHFALLPIKGAKLYRNGEAESLEGFKIEAEDRFVIELNEPRFFFPKILSLPAMAIVPEGSESFSGSWDEGCSGTGPFRVTSFDPGVRLDLERNPDYWRPGYPKSERLIFNFASSSEEIYRKFLRRRLSLVSELRPEHVEELRGDPNVARTFVESPRLATYFIVLNARHGVFRDPVLRREFARAIDLETPLRETTGHLAQPASRLIPPEMIDQKHSPLHRGPVQRTLRKLSQRHLKAVVIPSYRNQYSHYWDRLCASWQSVNLRVTSVGKTVPELLRLLREGQADLAGMRWAPGYPDTDGFVGSLLHSEDGFLGQICGDPAIDHLIEAGRSMSDGPARQEMYREIEKLIAREALLIPLFYEQTYRFLDPSVKGFDFGVTYPQVRYDELYTDQ